MSHQDKTQTDEDLRLQEIMLLSKYLNRELDINFSNIYSQMMGSTDAGLQFLVNFSLSFL